MLMCLDLEPFQRVPPGLLHSSVACCLTVLQYLSSTAIVEGLIRPVLRIAAGVETDAQQPATLLSYLEMSTACLMGIPTTLSVAIQS